MFNYKFKILWDTEKKAIPTIEGFQEVSDSLQNPTIERLIAGIQSKRTSKEQILDLTGDLRNSHTLLDKNLFQMNENTDNYNGKWAPEIIYEFGVLEKLLSEMRSMMKRWVKVLNITTPRYRDRYANITEQSVFSESYLTDRPYEQDMWGPASYGTLVYDLYGEMMVVVDHLTQGMQKCKDYLHQEQEINKDPKWKIELYNRQFKKIEYQCYLVIEKFYQLGIVNTDNRLYRDMMSSSNQQDFISNNFHLYTEQEYTEYVVTMSTLSLQNNHITPIEHELWDDNFPKIKLVRFAIENLDEIMCVKGNGKFDKFETLEFLKWCDVVKSPQSHKDSERKLFNYVVTSYHGNRKWYSWSALFETNKILKESVTDCIKYSTQFERKLNRFIVNNRLKIEEITGEGASIEPLIDYQIEQ